MHTYNYCYHVAVICIPDSIKSFIAEFDTFIQSHLGQKGRLRDGVEGSLRGDVEGSVTVTVGIDTGTILWDKRIVIVASQKILP